MGVWVKSIQIDFKENEEERDIVQKVHGYKKNWEVMWLQKRLHGVGWNSCETPRSFT